MSCLAQCVTRTFCWMVLWAVGTHCAISSLVQPFAHIRNTYVIVGIPRAPTRVAKLFADILCKMGHAIRVILSHLFKEDPRTPSRHAIRYPDIWVWTLPCAMCTFCEFPQPYSTRVIQSTVDVCIGREAEFVEGNFEQLISIFKKSLFKRERWRPTMLKVTLHNASQLAKCPFE